MNHQPSQARISPSALDGALFEASALPPDATEDDLLIVVARLERRLRVLRADPRLEPQHKAAAYRNLELELLHAAEAAGRLRPELGGTQGHLLLAELAEWRSMTASTGLTDASEAADELTLAFVRDEVADWQTHATAICRDPGPEACFDALMQTTLLEFELQLHPSDADSVHQAFADVRARLREAFRRAVDEFPPPATLVAQWTKRLTDRAETLLAAVDDLPAHRGALQLQQVADDIHWYLRYVACPRAGRRRLKHKLWRLRSEYQERALQDTLERQFGPRLVGWFDLLVIVLIFVVLGLLVVEMTVEMSKATLFWIHVADAACCAVFLWEFFYRLAHVPGKTRWFLRHFLIDMVPSIPLGLIFHSYIAETTRGIRAVRLARFIRLARYVRVIGFLTRGIDRLARQYGRLLNRNVILYPTRAERLRARHDSQSAVQRARRLRARLRESWKRLLAEAPDETTAAYIAQQRLTCWEACRAAGLARRPPQVDIRAAAAREIPADAMLRRLAAMTPQEVEDSLGDDLTARIARVVRVLARIPIRWMPVIRPYVPRITSRMGDSEVAAAAARSLAAGLKRHHDRWLWLADLYGTVSPSQFVDRIGTMMVRSSFRPAYRLALFGGIFLVTKQLLAFTHLLRPVHDFLNRTVGPTLMLLGGICFVILGIGWWLKRLAREATEFYERAAQAQFLPLTELIRSHSMERSVQVLYRRVLQPEWEIEDGLTTADEQARLEQFRQRIRMSLLGAGQDSRAGSAALDRVVLLYRDSLDGAMYVDNDTRTTSQLLGNPSVEQVLSLSGRVNRQFRKRLLLLDLERQKSLFGGPYLWFNFISRSIAHSVACLIVDYNRHAVPLAELPLVSPDERARYETWLRTTTTQQTEQREEPETDADLYVTTAFTALHFLDFDSTRDQEVEERFGPEVLARLRRDRSHMIRRVFGTYPLHRLPKDQRILNLFAVYETWLSGGRALLLPLFMLGRFLQYIGKFFRLIAAAVGELRKLQRRSDAEAAAEADFVTAVRKIGRMRSPVVFATIQVRAMIDPQYLGVTWPGEDSIPLDPQMDADLRFLDAEPQDVLPLRAERRRAEADMRRLTELIDSGLLAEAATCVGLETDAFNSRQHLRAAAVAFLGDYRNVRSHLSCREVLNEVISMAIMENLPSPRYFPRPRLWRRFLRYWKLYCEENPGTDAAARKSAWAAVVCNRDGVQRALRVWDELGEHARAEGEAILGNLLRHPSRISEQLVTVRAIQTLAMLDVLDYREHVFNLGQYAETGDEPGDLLHWDAVAPSPTVELGDTQAASAEMGEVI